MRRYLLGTSVVLGLSALGVACASLLGDFESGGGGGSLDAGDSGVRAEAGLGKDGGGTDAGGADGDAGTQPETSTMCTAPEQLCNATCVNTQTSPTDCGACGHACATGFTCSAGVCGNAVVSVAAGAAHTCAAVVRGDVYCWGTNAEGELGQGDAGGSGGAAILVPRDSNQNTVSGQAGVTAGASHVCALAATGKLECWGSGTYGQMSNGVVSIDAGVLNQPIPTLAQQSLTLFGPQIPYASVARGGLADHACAVIDGGVVCWGENSNGQLGHSSSVDAGLDRDCGDTRCKPTPTVATVATFLSVTPKQVAVGADFTCALTPAGAIVCWGNNFNGTLGLGTRGFLVPDAGPAVIDAGLTYVAGGSQSACAVANDGNVWCWGANSAGQLGHDAGTGTDVCCSIDCGFSFPPPYCTPSPSRLGGISSATQVAVGCAHACALKSDGTVWCWGANDKGQLGTGDNVASASPRHVTSLAGAAGLAMGCNHSCAFTTSGQVFCWGLNADGELGNSGGANTNTPVAVQGLPR